MWVPAPSSPGADRSLSVVQPLYGCIFFSAFTQSLLSVQVSCRPALPREALLDRGVSVWKIRAAVTLPELHLNVGFSRESVVRVSAKMFSEVFTGSPAPRTTTAQAGGSASCSWLWWEPKIKGLGPPWGPRCFPKVLRGNLIG